MLEVKQIKFYKNYLVKGLYKLKKQLIGDTIGGCILTFILSLSYQNFYFEIVFDV